METMGTAAPLPPMPAYSPGGHAVVLKVSHRWLWVGDAAYPLHNLTRVLTDELKPQRMAAFLNFLKWVGVTLVVFVLLQSLNDNGSLGSSSEADTADLLWLLAFSVVIGLFVHMVQEMLKPNQHVLIVETASSSMAVVTLPSMEALQGVVRHIVQAIENPQSEFQVVVGRLSVSPKNYHFGDNVNIYGGSGNAGVVKR
jgi:hypothetical protein